MDYRISLTGDIGSGKTTVGKLLIDRFKADFYSTGVLVRKIAADRGMTVVDINKFMESQPDIDYEMDNRLKGLSDAKGNLIVDSRLAWHFTKNTFKVYLATDSYESAKRVFNDKRAEESFESIEATEKKIRARKDSENMRYLDLYGINCGYMDNYDLVIDTTATSAEKVAEVIAEECIKFSHGEKITKFRMFGGRLKPTTDISDIKITNEPINGELELIICGTDYYIKNPEDHAKVLSCIAAGNNLIPCVGYFVNEAPKTDTKLIDNWKNAVKEAKK